MSVRLSYRSTKTTTAGGFAAEPPAGRRYRSMAADTVMQAPALNSNAGSVML